MVHRFWRPRAAALLLAAAALFVAATTSRDTRACGAFLAQSAQALTEKELSARLPYLAVEQVLLVWDRATGTEDFVREARFEKADHTFGFVVPVPSRPEVFKVDHAPFAALRKMFPYDPPVPPASPPKGGGGLLSGGPGGGAAPPAVVVLSEQRIGSFTAFVLAASDATGFAKWLVDNGLRATDATREWLAHYVRLGFFYVALRYEPSAADAGATEAMTSETVRIRFKTPNPYYPYLEPRHATDAASPSARLLSLWFVSQEDMVPVANTSTGMNAPPAWQKPWSTGERYTSTQEFVKKGLASLEGIVPAGKLVVQTFRDTKRSREAWGDVLMIATKTEAVDEATRAARMPLLGVIDSALEPPSTANVAGETTASPTTSSATPTPTSTASAKKTSHGCQTSAGTAPSGQGAVLAIFALLLLAFRRQRRIASVTVATVVALTVGTALVACREHASTNAATDAASVASSSSAGSATTPEANLSASKPVTKPPPPPPLTASERSARESVALDALRGLLPNALPERSSDTATMPRALASVGSVAASNVPDAERVVRASLPRARSCYQRGLQSDPSMEGKLTLALTIDASGAVASSSVTHNTGLSSLVAQCVAAQMKRAEFSAPTARASTVTLTYAFARE